MLYSPNQFFKTMVIAPGSFVEACEAIAAAMGSGYSDALILGDITTGDITADTVAADSVAAESISLEGTTGSIAIKLANNTSYTPASGENSIYLEGGVLSAAVDGAKYTVDLTAV